MIRHQPFILALLIALAPAFRPALADAYDPPAGYYSTATGTGATLKAQLNSIIDGHTTRSYDQIRSDLQVTDDATPANLSDRAIRLIYNDVNLNVASLTGPPAGWDFGTTWNREHSWPQSRGIDTTSVPDGTDLHHMFPADTDENNTRGNLNFGGAFGAQSFGVVTDGGTKYYPGDADAGMIARAQFYMAVRYDGADSGTQDLELATGNPADGGTTLGDLTRLIEWHFAAPPNAYERRRNQIIYDNYQGNRNPFVDRPEYAWSTFMNQTNDSQLTLASPTTINTTTGSSTKIVNLTNVIVGGTVPAAQSVTLNKSGNNGTYYSVTTGGLATSTVTGPLNAYRIITSGTDSKSFSVGLNTNTVAAGLRTGTVTVDNLDITAGSNGGVGHAANDANDVITVNLNVLDHATPLFASNQATSLTLDFGNIALGDGTPSLGFDVLNKLGTASFTAALDLDSFTPSGNTGAFTTNLAPFSSLAAGSNQTFTTSFIATSVGTFTANFTLNLSDENLSGATNKLLALTLTGKTRLAGDYNGDLVVDANDYVVWRETMGQSSPAFGGADGDGSGLVTDDDYSVWRAHFGQTATAAGASFAAAIPEPGTAWIALLTCATLFGVTDRRSKRILRR